jgi:type VI secretion system secreted protein VgrG
MIFFRCQALGELRVSALRGTERISELPDWELEVLSTQVDLDLEAAVGQIAELLLRDDVEGTSRTLELMVTEMLYDGPTGVSHRYRLRLSAPTWRLTLRRGYRLELELAAHEMVEMILRDAGVPDGRLRLRIAGDTFQRDQITQYDETDWAFIERLLAEEGFSYWFDHEEGTGSILVVGDGHGAHDGIIPPMNIPFHGTFGMNAPRTLQELELSEELVPTGVYVRDFDVRQPNVYIEGEAGDEDLRHFEYPAFVPDNGAATTRAAVRLDQLQRLEVQATGRSDCIRLQPGRLLRLEQAFDEDMNQEYLVVAVEHSFREGTDHDPRNEGYRNRVVMVPSELRAFRPPWPTRPRVHRIERARTTGPSGEEIHVDDLARVSLRFQWDPSDRHDETSSTWARGLQWALSGSMFLSRVGWEAPVMYLDGSPDRPFVLQRLYNGGAPPPYALPAQAATTAIKSVSSPGGAGVSEIRLGDSAGAEEFYIHAARDFSASVGGDATADVTGDLQHDITGSLFSVVTSSSDISIDVSQSVDVGTDYATTVQGTHLNVIAAAEIQNTSANKVVSTGPYAEGVKGRYALQCNQSNLISGPYLHINRGTCNLNAALSTAENVAGARGERVGGPYSITTSGAFTDETWGYKKVISGPISENGTEIVNTAPLGEVSAGTAVIDAGQTGIVGNIVTVKARMLKAGAFQLAGGVMRSKGGKTVLKADKIRIPSGATFKR